MNVRLVLNKRLGAVAMVDIPIDDQDPMQAVLVSRIVCGDGNISEEAESHRAIANGVVPGRPHRAEAARMNARYRQIDA